MLKIPKLCIFQAIDRENFNLIQNCEVAKNAWITLEVAFEGTAKVKCSRVWMIKSQFEQVMMKEGETIADFNTRVMDITNESASIGNTLSEEEPVEKVL